MVQKGEIELFQIIGSNKDNCIVIKTLKEGEFFNDKTFFSD